jgi:hypothetical protein
MRLFFGPWIHEAEHIKERRYYTILFKWLLASVFALATRNLMCVKPYRHGKSLFGQIYWPIARGVKNFWPYQCLLLFQEQFKKMSISVYRYIFHKFFVLIFESRVNLIFCVIYRALHIHFHQYKIYFASCRFLAQSNLWMLKSLLQNLRLPLCLCIYAVRKTNNWCTQEIGGAWTYSADAIKIIISTKRRSCSLRKVFSPLCFVCFAHHHREHLTNVFYRAQSRSRSACTSVLQKPLTRTSAQIHRILLDVTRCVIYLFVSVWKKQWAE